MGLNRRSFVKHLGGAFLAAGMAGTRAMAQENESSQKNTDVIGCLVDTTRCIGCRKCEEACNQANQLPRPEEPFDNKWVLRERRRPDVTRYTVINSYPGCPSSAQPDRKETYVKVQCMHCLDPACVSACIVGALTKSDDGPVVYDAQKCIGCRYCLVACPFEIPAYEYDEPLVPKVMKCTYCVDEKTKTSASPACAAACPMEAIIFGERSSLLALARQRIKKRPNRYIKYIYGEQEVGGTSWLYLTGRPYEELDLLRLPKKSPARLSESIQHGIFNYYGAIPVAIYGGLAGLMWLNNRKNNTTNDAHK